MNESKKNVTYRTFWQTNLLRVLVREVKLYG